MAELAKANTSPLSPSTAAFHELLEREKLEALAEFAAGAGHEINNPLAVICGRVELLLQHEQHTERRRDLATIHAQAMRIHDLIADLMLFARPPEPRFEPLDAAELLDELFEELQPAFQAREAQLYKAEHERPLTLRGDRTQLLLVLREICENALREARPGGRVVVAARPVPLAEGFRVQGSGFRIQGAESEDPNQTPDAGTLNPEPRTLNPRHAVQITVHDDGPGIPEEVRRHLFDPFYSGRAAGRGLGMGLAKCWRIITLHAGRIEVESQPGCGATFVITLPQ